MGRSKVYLASSWRNSDQKEAVKKFRDAGFPTYDFRNPKESWTKQWPGNGDGGFQWTEIDPHWQQWTPWSFLAALDTQIAQDGYDRDATAMGEADVGVLLLPSGRSAHIEAGYFSGHPSKSLHIILPNELGERVPGTFSLWEPELMYKLADGVHLSVDACIEAMRGY